MTSPSQAPAHPPGGSSGGARSPQTPRLHLEIVSRYPQGRTHPTPLLFVHGALHAAWCWEVHFLPYFALHGYAAHAVSLRGHGHSAGRATLRWTRIADYVADVAQVAQDLPCPPILIGHSMGGFIIQKYLEQHAAPGAVLLSSPPPAGMRGTALRIARRHPLVFARVSLTRSLSPLVADPRLVREAFFSDDVPHDQLLAYTRQMHDDSYMAYLDMVVLDLPKPAKVRTPLLVLGVRRDHMISPREIAATAQAYHTRVEMIADVAHDSMLEPRWEAVAERILGWLTRERGW